ncbi:UDP-3-O-(3-hydroxymyristoyl)glucosamine N-acyltransferase [Campylobacter sp. FMV-PI01]|uniref:UDP-3-O-acylglucosamine N-acyltransferase n=1 Tax=Campylobacter portucalensis TaxID=2608384 RepID=A0A6L5WMA5_9BACT|nr:UDP-3-O-(3-hydroxymyristoyl)glucosamine N-acyltransferase [Campylobacter portucalensis]MSN96801.1 UDP-3-O-(3-hydroxymyristoyl)glucosamine N-acyltransferase [Campylobacter portucalensis]
MKLSKICEILDIKFDGKDCEINSLNSIEFAKGDELSYCDSEKNAKFLEACKAKAILITPNLKNLVSKECIILECKNPHLCFAILSKFFAKDLLRDKKSNKISEFAKIMPGAYIGSGVSIDNSSLIMPGAYIGDDVSIGQNCIIHPNVVIYNDTKIGDNCIINANSVIGSDGFGFAHKEDGTHIKIYHNGNVVVEDDVEIGACVTIDRAVFATTLIKKGTKIDNLVQIGHNCELGENCLIVSQTGLSGSTILGKNVIMGGQSGTAGHLKIGDFAMIAARGGVSKNLEGGKKYAGHPLCELKDWFKIQAKIHKNFK